MLAGCALPLSDHPPSSVAFQKPLGTGGDAVGQTILAELGRCGRERAREAKRLSGDNAFLRRLRDHYLQEYLKDPNEETAKTALARMGREDLVALFGVTLDQATEQFVKKNFGAGLPAHLDAIHPFIRDRALPNIDVPYLLGKPSSEVDYRNDWVSGGKNWSHVVHWSNGVRYSDGDESVVRALFLAYELWHLEGWDVFGEDPINDLISSDQGYQIGRAIREGRIQSEQDLHEVAEEAFRRARCWVGKLLRLRRREWEDFVTAPEIKKASRWWQDTRTAVWSNGNGEPYRSLRTVLMQTQGDLEALRGNEYFGRLCDIAALTYEAEACEMEWNNDGQRNDPITPRTSLQMDLITGRYNKVFESLEGGEPECELVLGNDGLLCRENEDSQIHDQEYGDS